MGAHLCSAHSLHSAISPCLQVYSKRLVSQHSAESPLERRDHQNRQHHPNHTKTKDLKLILSRLCWDTVRLSKDFADFDRFCSSRLKQIFWQQFQKQLRHFFVSEAHHQCARVNEAMVKWISALCHHIP